MKCRLCDRPTAAGTGKLCADCAKALRRARGAASRTLPPAAAIAAELSSAAPITLTVVAPAAPRTPSERTTLWAGIGLAALAAVFVAQRELSPPRGADASGPDQAPTTMTERVNVEPSPAVTRVEEPSWTAVGDASKTAPESETAPAAARAGAAKLPIAPTGAKPGGKTAKAASQDSKAVRLPLPAEYAAVPQPAEAEAQPQLTGGKVAAPTQPVDGAQVLASAMQKCGSEGFLSKFICEQKAFIQYCEDKWDKDPKCMRKVNER